MLKYIDICILLYIIKKIKKIKKMENIINFATLNPWTTGFTGFTLCVFIIHRMCVYDDYTSLC